MSDGKERTVIYEFESRSAGTVVMNRSFAEAILEALGREAAAGGKAVTWGI